MASEYIDTILVECDRSSATIKHDDNPSSLTNQQNNTLQLLPNDKVSVYSSYINDVGSGQEAPIEFRGKRLGKTKQIQVINQVSQITQTRLTAQQETHVIYTTDELQTLDVEEKDNEANVVVNFYKTMDANNYIQCPRRFIPSTEELLTSNYGGGVPEVYWAITDKVVYGRTHVEEPRIAVPLVSRPGESNYYGYQPNDMRGFLSYEEAAPPPSTDEPRFGQPVHWILKNDNTRYTIMKKLNNTIII